MVVLSTKCNNNGLDGLGFLNIYTFSTRKNKNGKNRDLITEDNKNKKSRT